MDFEDRARHVGSHAPVRSAPLLLSGLLPRTLSCWYRPAAVWTTTLSLVRWRIHAGCSTLCCWRASRSVAPDRKDSAYESRSTRARTMIFSPNGSNQSTKPTAPLRNEPSVFGTTPSTSSRFPASLVRFSSSRSRTPAVLFFNDSRGLSLSR